MDFEQRLSEHMERDEKQFDKIADSLDEIKSNHLAHLQEAATKSASDITWIKSGLYLVGATGLATFLGMLYRLVKP